MYMESVREKLEKKKLKNLLEHWRGGTPVGISSSDVRKLQPQRCQILRFIADLVTFVLSQNPTQIVTIAELSSCKNRRIIIFWGTLYHNYSSSNNFPADPYVFSTGEELN